MIGRLLRTISGLWKVFWAKRMIAQTEIGATLLKVAPAVKLYAATRAELKRLGQAHALQAPIGLFFIDERQRRRDQKPLCQKTVVFLHSLSIPKLAVVLAHELTHAADRQFHIYPEKYARQSEAAAVAVQHQFARELLRQRPWVKRALG